MEENNRYILISLLLGLLLLIASVIIMSGTVFDNWGLEQNLRYTLSALIIIGSLLYVWGTILQKQNKKTKLRDSEPENGAEL